MNKDLKQLAHLHDERIDLNSLKENLAKKYGHLNWAQIKNKTRKGELDVSDLIAFCHEANRLFYEKEIERLKKTLSEIENAMERWHHGRDEDVECIYKINNILLEIGLLTWFNQPPKQ